MVTAHRPTDTSLDLNDERFDADYTKSDATEGLQGAYLADEQTRVESLLSIASESDSERDNIHKTASGLVEHVRKQNEERSGIEAFLQKYDLSSQEGIMLMCVAEALLRIPDSETADALIADKITAADWSRHLGSSESLFVNASTWGLMLTGKMLTLDEAHQKNPRELFKRMVSRAGEPVVRSAMRQAMKVMGHQFVMGRDIGSALKRADKGNNRDYRYSFDMLGEAALTRADAQRYFKAYEAAIDAIGAAPSGDDIFSTHSISVKLSALHPRYEFARRQQAMDELAPQLLALAQRARAVGIGLTMDAEEADRLELSLEIFASVFGDPSLEDYEGLGLAVQAYQKRGVDVVRWLIELARTVGRRIPVRLVKGAYWDTEIKHAQELGLAGYPVFTRKVNTDVSYLACARLMLDAAEQIYPQFATHNAHTLAYVLHHAGGRSDYEFQRLHGMGESLYATVIDPERYNRQCRVYAPVGSHEDLLPYLVRRLLENGANTSFVNQIVDPDESIDEIVADPIQAVRDLDQIPHEKIPLPSALFGEHRKNSAGVNLPDREVGRSLYQAMAPFFSKHYDVQPVINGSRAQGGAVNCTNPFDSGDVVGAVVFADSEVSESAVATAVEGFSDWESTPATDRAKVLEAAADLFESQLAEFCALCIREAGKTLPDAIAEVREAVDFLRYYAAEARRLFSEPTVLAGPTGEHNVHGMRGRGVFVCVSPWNFPLAIFTGQVVAALAAGNTVVAKPAEQTSIVAARACDLLWQAGVPVSALQFLPGEGGTAAATAIADARVAGVAFTGSTETAMTINRTLAMRDGQIGALIAETGGQNAMIVDSSALPEQVVQDAVMSGFNSAGQRCSALRVLCVQRDIAPRVIELLKGAMDELNIGDPLDLKTDVGPVIDEAARSILESHVERMREEQSVLHQCVLPATTKAGVFFPPTLIQIDSLSALQREVFGPVVHIYPFDGPDLAKLVAEINSTGYGLTFGVHTRIDGRAVELASAIRAGNVYINRNMVGAVVGVQPFGGRGLSGTGPKAGGPNYLARFGTEYAISTNTAAVGGNASLLSLD
ncbi:MAG: bifunctional proline dehydrogenase/L-glutamate gamma-semialdehyde dehydrogenase PutA [Pseudomonadota bacterium]